MLRRQIGFQWKNTNYCEDCQISQKPIGSGIGFFPVIADVPGVPDLFIDPGILKQYAPDSYTLLLSLRKRYHIGLTKEEVASAPQGVSHRFTLHIPVASPTLDAVFALMANEIITHCAVEGIGVGEVIDWTDKDDISEALLDDVFASYGFYFGNNSSVKDNNVLLTESLKKSAIDVPAMLMSEQRDIAIARVRKIAAPILFSAYFTHQGDPRTLEEAIVELQKYDHANSLEIQKACDVLDIFV